jgi:hypothetical protein
MEDPLVSSGSNSFSRKKKSSTANRSIKSNNSSFKSSGTANAISAEEKEM